MSDIRVDLMFPVRVQSPACVATIQQGDMGMDDLTVRRLCLKAVGLEQDHTTMLPAYFDAGLGEWGRVVEYDPFHDDAQCFALIEKFEPSIIRPDSNGWWDVYMLDSEFSFSDKDLKRCICLCCAQMQQTKGERDAG